MQYLSSEMRRLELAPGNPDGSYIQEVPLAGILAHPRRHSPLRDKRLQLNFPDDYVASSAHLQNEIKVDDSDIVFVGYGIVAPEYGWDDYKGVGREEAKRS